MTADIPHIHVPQNAAPSGRGAGGMRFGASEKADSLFHAAQRHSDACARFEDGAPVAAISAGCGLLWYTFLATPASPVKGRGEYGRRNGQSLS